MSSLSNHTFIDLFAGCGGLSLGLIKSGWKGLFSIEKDDRAFNTLKHNLIDKNKFDWPSWLPQTGHDINNILKKYKKELSNIKGNVTLVAGGPPCQGFSTAGKKDINDKRNKLVTAYIRFIEIVDPELVFFENVKGFTMNFKGKNSPEKVYSEYVRNKLEKKGFTVKAEIIKFSEFGIPQTRNRFILVGIKNGHSDSFFINLVDNKNRFLKLRKLNKDITLRKAISDLERKHGELDSKEYTNFKEGIYGKAESNYQKYLRRGYKKHPDSHRFANHRPDTINKFDYILKNSRRNKKIGQEIRDKFQFKKDCIIPLDRNQPCPTLTTLPDDYIHYSEPRILTVREYARIQSFNDWYEFKGRYTNGGKLRREEVPRYTQVGNAIPPLFMEQCGEVLKRMT